jgi:two-component system CheB/CheR fusion protein
MQQLLTVGIGASAGGIQALKELFEHTPPDAGIAYVVILHLSPDYDSQLAHILGTVTPMPVTQLNERAQLAPDRVYVIPPNQHLTMEDGFINVNKNLTVEERRAPVDIFFRSLAESHGANAVCVLLSGTGANGSMGLKRVKERGGAVFVQRPSEAEFEEMPRNAIATELVDEVLNVADIPAHIVAYKQRMGLVYIPEDSDRRAEADQQALRKIFKQLRLRTGNDFSNYKKPTLLRRIERRINVRALPDLPSYAMYLVEQPAEVQALLKDLLISVTNFFRDERAFAELERSVIPELFKAKRNEDQIRIWIAGCATGEEAYSFAMLCAEYADNLVNGPKLQIFATDIDEAALAIAREGLYTLNDAADVPPERLRRFFSYEGNAGYRVRREIRESILFAHHNFLKDPPFSRLDLVSCRNVMIYLNQIAQERVMETFHFALNPGGFLFLGNAEGIDGSTDLYAALDREQHIYQSRQVASRKFLVPESIPEFRTEHTAKEVQRDAISNGERISYGELHQRLLEAYAPPSLVVNEDYDIVHVSERAGRFLQVSGGEVSKNLLKLIREELRLELSAALYQAVQRQTAVDVPNLQLQFDDRNEIVNVSVRPVLGQNNNAKGFILIVFEPGSAAADQTQPLIFSGSEPIARQLEDENTRLKAQLRAANEQHEFGVEELKANNEELQAMNEELRSAAEELETSREELQSVNEELRTLSDTVPQLIWTNTPEGEANYFNRRWYEYSGRTREDSLGLGWQILVHPEDEVASVERWHAALNAGQVFDTEFRLRAASGAYRWFIGRNVPLRDKHGNITGWFGTATDIQDLKEAQESLHASRESLRVTMESATDYAIIAMDTAGIITGWSVGAELIFGYSLEDAIGQPSSLIFTPEDVASGRPEQELAIAVADGKAPDERWHIRADGSRFYMSGVVRPIYDEVLIGFVKVARDMTATHEAQEALRISEERYRIALQSAGMGAWDWNLITDRTVWNDQHFIMFGVEPSGKPEPSSYFMQFIHPDDGALVKNALAQAIEHSGIYHTIFRIIRDDNGEVRWMSGYGRVINRDGDTATRMVGVMYDITEQKQLEQQKDAFIGIASHELKTPVSSIKAYAEVLQEMFEENGAIEQAGIMRRMDEQIDRLAELIHALLDVTMLAEGKMQFRRVRFDLTELIRDTRDEMQRTTRHEIGFQAEEVIYVTGDPERIRQVLFNLISNAIKYSPANERILITTRQERDEVITCVEDFGIGMSENVAAQVFDRFFRSDDPLISTYPGLGLGLHISSEFVQRHGGRIWVDRSEPGKGSAFCFSIPVNHDVKAEE